MRLTDLRDKKVRTLDGNSFGRVHEVQCEDGKIVALRVGATSLIERMTAKNHGRRIAWDRVLKVEPKQIVVTLDPRKRKKS
jgi:sporulation protein YlmC with PRC-barrel domain